VVAYHSSEFGSGGCRLWHNKIKIGIQIFWTQIDFDKIKKNDEFILVQFFATMFYFLDLNFGVLFSRMLMMNLECYNISTFLV